MSLPDSPYLFIIGKAVKRWLYQGSSNLSRGPLPWYQMSLMSLPTRAKKEKIDHPLPSPKVLLQLLLPLPLGFPWELDISGLKWVRQVRVWTQCCTDTKGQIQGLKYEFLWPTPLALDGCMINAQWLNVGRRRGLIGLINEVAVL